MMVSMPSAGALGDLATLLQLLQAASDPKKSVAIITKLQAERQQYDDAIVAADDRAKKAQAVEALALAAVEKAEAAEAKANGKLTALETRSAEVADEIASLQSSVDEINKVRAALIVRGQAIDAREEALTAQAGEFSGECLTEREAIESEWVTARTANAEAAALQADYEAKLAKFKALTE